MATTRIKDLTNTATTVASDEYLAVDGTTNGTSKITRDNFRTDTAAAFVAAPGTYNLAPLSGGAVPIDKGGTAATTASGARTSLDVPSNSEAVLVANNLSDVTAATARTNLSVNSVDEDAEATATKLVGPAMYFNGSSSVVTVADDSKLTFSSSAEFGTNSSGTWSPNDNTPALTDGTGTLNQHYRVDSGAGTVTQGASTLSIINGTATTAGQAVYYDGSVWRLKDVDDLPFSISFWIKHDFSATGTNVMFGKYGLAAPAREWWFYFSSNLLYFSVVDSAGVESFTRWSVADNSNQWTHICLTQDASGPSSSNAFTAVADGMSLYVNGQLVSPTSRYNDASYSGMNDSSQPLWFGKSSSSFGGGEYRSVQIFNRELTATEVAQLARGVDLGYSDEWAESNGGTYTSNFSSTTDSFTTSATSLAQIGGSIDGRSNLLRIAGDGTSANHAAIRNVGATVGKRYRITLDYDIQGSNTVVDGVRMRWNNGTEYSSTGTTAGAWGRIEFESVATDASFEIYMMDGAAQVNAAPATDYIYVSSVTVTEIGTLASFSAENYDADTAKLYDISDNAFVGTGTSVSLTGRAYPIYTTGSWTPSITFGGGSTGVTYTEQEGFYVRIGNLVRFMGSIRLSSKGTDTGALKIAGLPFTGKNTSTSNDGVILATAANFTGLTSTVTARVDNNDTTITVLQWAATGTTGVTDAECTNTTVIGVSGTYQIQ